MPPGREGPCGRGPCSDRLRTSPFLPERVTFHGDRVHRAAPLAVGAPDAPVLVLDDRGPLLRRVSAAKRFPRPGRQGQFLQGHEFQAQRGADVGAAPAEGAPLRGADRVHAAIQAAAPPPPPCAPGGGPPPPRPRPGARRAPAGPPLFPPPPPPRTGGGRGGPAPPRG